MIKATLYKEHKGFCVTGHSGFAESGSDIVCAAVSILATTCVNALEAVAGVEPNVVTRDGYLKAVLPDDLPPGIAHDAAVILNTFAVGLQDLREGYSDYITVRIGGTIND